MRVIDIIQKIAREEAQRFRTADVGEVISDASKEGAGYGSDVKLRSGTILRNVPIATSHIGTVAIPSKGDQVLIAFHLGELNAPVIVGRLYTNKQRNPECKPNQIIVNMPPDKEADEGVAIKLDCADKDALGCKIQIGKITLQVTDAGGQPGVKLTVDGSKSTTIKIGDDGSVSIESGGNIDIKCDGNLSLAAKGDVKIDAGGKAEISAKMGAKVDGGLSAEIDGTNITVKGMTSFSM